MQSNHAQQNDDHALPVSSDTADAVSSGAYPASHTSASAELNAVYSAQSEMDEARWLQHYRNNQLNRSEPDWTAPITMTPGQVKVLARSIAQFQLGDGGGPGCLIAWNAQSFRGNTAGTQELVDLWFREEKEHSRLLGCLLARLDGTPISGHWSFSCFCWVRRVMGVRFELLALLLTEIAATIYYKVMRRHTPDAAVRQVCTLILRDEGGHIAFHRDRMARAAFEGRASYGWLWEACFRTLGLGAATMLWVNHARSLCPFGATTVEYYGEVWREMSTFLRRLRRDARRLKEKSAGTRREASAAAQRPNDKPLALGV
ncbi:MAG: hypothetical protein ACAI35_02055 [Candidatus Methylacidiphilales bacterium]